MSEAWKDHERVCAKRLGGKRVGPTGKEGSDVDHPLLAIECKERRRPLSQEIIGALAQAIGAAKKDQVPLVIWHTFGTRHDHDVVMLRLKDFEELYGKLPEVSE